MARTMDPMETPQQSPPPKSDSDKKLHRWATALYEEGCARRRHWEGVWWENFATFMGDFWVEWDIHKRALIEPVKKPEHRVRLPINLAQPVVRTELAKLTKNRPIMEPMARSSDQEDLNAAKVADKLLNNYVERQFHMARVRRRMLEWVLICGMGGIVADFDDTALGEMNVLTDGAGNPIFDPRAQQAWKDQLEKKKQQPNYIKVPQGELIYKPASPWEFMWDFSTNYLEDAKWAIYTSVFDCDEVFRRWGKHVSEDPTAIPGVISNRLIQRFDLTSKLQVHVQHVQKLTTVHQMWILPGHPRFSQGLCLVFDKNTIIDNRPFDYGHGELPIQAMGHIPFPVSQYGMSVLQQVRGPVIEISKTESQLIENRNLMGNPMWLIPKQAQITKPIVNRPGARIEFNYMPNVPEPKPVEMPDLPSYIPELINILKEHVLEIGGQGETSQGRVPPGARSGVAIAYLQEEDDTRLGVTVQAFEETMERVANITLTNIAEKYTVPRQVQIYKRRGDVEVIDFVGTQLAGVAGVVCQAGSALPRSKAAKQQYILDLWDRKLEQDPRKVRQMLELSEGEPDEWEVDLDQAERENHEMMNGNEQLVLEWYNHPAHHYVHRNYMKSADFASKPDEIKEIFYDHDAEHTHYEEIQAQEVAAMQAQQSPQGGGGQGGSAPGGSTVPSAANGQNVPQGPPPQFSAATSPRSLMSQEPQ